MESEEKSALILELDKLHSRHELLSTIGPDYFEPGNMEYLEQSEGIYFSETDAFLLRFEAKGTRYDGRTEQIEKVKLGDPVQLERDRGNTYNFNNFRILTQKGKDIGNVPAELCNVLAPLYDTDRIEFVSACVSYVEPLSLRNRHARKAILFIELRGRFCSFEIKRVDGRMEPL